MSTATGNIPELKVIHDHHLQYEGNTGVFSILGSLSMDISSLRVTIHVTSQERRKQRLKIDLYDYTQIQKHCIYLSEQEGFEFGKLETDFLQLTKVLEEYREKIFQEDYAEIPRNPMRLSLTKEKEIVETLKQPDLLEYLDKKLGEIGIVGEESNRLLLFIIGLTYKTSTPLHAIVQSSSGSGKSHLINSISNCFLEEDVLSLSRITSKSLYHFKKDALKEKIVVIQDYDGLDEDALFAFRELQSYGELTTSITGKDAFGNHSARINTVTGHFSSFGATTRAVYNDNVSRSILLQMDETEEQTERISAYTPNIEEETKAQGELKNLVRMIKPVSVTNPFASDITIPHHIHSARRLNQHLKTFISQITMLHQHSREKDKEGRIITTQEDVINAVTLFFNSIWLKSDELEPQIREFFEKLKLFIKSKEEEGNTNQFTQREVRQAFGLSKSGVHRHIKELLSMEYIAITNGSKNRGFRYTIVYWDNAEKLKVELKANILKGVSHGVPNSVGHQKSRQAKVLPLASRVSKIHE